MIFHFYQNDFFLIVEKLNFLLAKSAKQPVTVKKLGVILYEGSRSNLWEIQIKIQVIKM